MPGKTYVDDPINPTKAICKLDMSWVYISDNADVPWIEEVLRELQKQTWFQVVWAPESDVVKLAEKLGFINPVTYNFIYYEQKNE